jgi:hypothetical protein
MMHSCGRNIEQKANIAKKPTLSVVGILNTKTMYWDEASTICGWNIKPIACSVMEPAPSVGGILD